MKKFNLHQTAILCVFSVLSTIIGIIIGILIYTTIIDDNNTTNVNIKEALAQQTKCHQQAIDILHIVYEDSKDPESPMYNYWLDVLCETDAYQVYNESINGDWEDFYNY